MYKNRTEVDVNTINLIERNKFSGRVDEGRAILRATDHDREAIFLFALREGPATNGNKDLSISGSSFFGELLEVILVFGVGERDLIIFSDFSERVADKGV